METIVWKQSAYHHILICAASFAFFPHTLSDSLFLVNITLSFLPPLTLSFLLISSCFFLVYKSLSLAPFTFTLSASLGCFFYISPSSFISFYTCTATVWHRISPPPLSLFLSVHWYSVASKIRSKWNELWIQAWMKNIFTKSLITEPMLIQIMKKRMENSGIFY